MEETDMVQLINSATTATRNFAARSLDPAQRRDLAVQVVAGNESVSQTARDHHVSRKFVAAQTDKVQSALDREFTPPKDDDKVLFSLPVTSKWIEQAVLGLLLINHSSLRGVQEFFRDLIDYPIAHTTVRNIFQKAVGAARAIDARVDLKAVRIGAHDEIFQGGQPVLVGADVDSTYCYLLAHVAHRDAKMWALHLSPLADRGFAPQATVADFGTGLRAGQKQAFPDLPCRGDRFHAIKSLRDVARTLDRRACRKMEFHLDFQAKQARHVKRYDRKDPTLAESIARAENDERTAIALADDVRLLIDWLRGDIWSVAGPTYAQRCELYDFVLVELRERIAAAGIPLRKVCTTLGNHRDELLAFAQELDVALAALDAKFEVKPGLAREILQHEDDNPNRPEYWKTDADLHRQSRGQLYAMRAELRELRQRTVRASSVVENLNSRLRGYFFLRRKVDPEYLDGLRFFLNHRRFVRSERPERTGKSPRELLTGETHPHWLEILGYRRFQQN